VLLNASSDSKLTYLSETNSLVGFGSRERPSNNLRRRQAAPRPAHEVAL